MIWAIDAKVSAETAPAAREAGFRVAPPAPRTPLRAIRNQFRRNGARAGVGAVARDQRVEPVPASTLVLAAMSPSLTGQEPPVRAEDMADDVR